MTIDNMKLVNMTHQELIETDGGVFPPLVVGVALVGGAFVLGLCVGVAVGYTVYKLTHL
jgi:lactobin A/cerein 7B family class IIb bacteriocin